MCTSSGILMFTLIDETSASWNILLFALLEVITVSWIYGIDRFFENLDEMSVKFHFLIKLYWKVCWTFITPVLLAVLVVWKFISTGRVKYGDYDFPDWVQALGWMFGVTSVLMLPLVSIRQILIRRSKGQELGRALFRPTEEWLPAALPSKGKS